MSNPYLHTPQTIDQLEAILRRHQIDLSRWGLGKAKGVAQLWEEICKGESTLQTDPLRRSVAVVSLIFRREKRVLLEIGQEMADGRRRERHQPPSEKLLSGEMPLAAARRCAQEELGLAKNQVDFQNTTPLVSREMRPSRSYPGLATDYTIYLFEASSEFLPDGSFTTCEGDEAQPGLVRTHTWAWVEMPADGRPDLDKLRLN